jgi:hypothetical protein
MRLRIRDLLILDPGSRIWDGKIWIRHVHQYLYTSYFMKNTLQMCAQSGYLSILRPKFYRLTRTQGGVQVTFI